MSTQRVSAGSRIGPYEIVSRIGAGGMGEVWRATDTRLQRSVAIKLLPGEFASNAQLRIRFQREARTISQLNHPNICVLHDVGESEGLDYLVMELLDGETLADRLGRGGALPLQEVLRYGREIADALDRAHRQGVVHRDLKPGNIMLTRSGAKLLDFGLAKTSSAPASEEDATVQQPITEKGMVLGTFQYMSPEQVAGSESDSRSDIFALGVVLYEMATGERAFSGATRTSLVSAIVAGQPRPLRELQPLTPPALEHVITKCLEKDPNERWQSAHDVAAELKWIGEMGTQPVLTAEPAVQRKRRFGPGWLIHLAIAAAAVTVGWGLAEWRKPSPPLVHASIAFPPGMRLSLNGGLAVSPDGSMVVASLDDQKGTRTLWVRSLSGSSFRRLEGTDEAFYPFWSPDSKRIGFFSTGKLRIVDSSGGIPRTLADAPGPRGGAWSPNGTIVFAPLIEGALAKVHESGGTPEPATTLGGGEMAHRWPVFLPDGESFLFTGMGTPGIGTGIHRGSLADPQERTLVVNAHSSVGLSRDHLFFAREGNIVVQRFDPRSATLSGEPRRVLEDVATTERLDAIFSVSAGGTLIAQRGLGFVPSKLVFVDRGGNELETLTEEELFFSPRLSRDGARVAVDRSDSRSGQGDIWIFDLRRGVPTRLTFQVENESGPNWSRDDRHVYFHRGIQGGSSIERVASGGTGEVESLVASPEEKRLTHVTHDGTRLLFDVNSGESRSDIWIYSIDERAAQPWLATPFNERGAELSPDGSWIVYQSDESGQNEIYVRAFPRSERKWQITSGGGVMPAWRADGKEIFYVSTTGMMMAIPVELDGDLRAGEPQALFHARVRQHANRQFDVSADGSRFLLNQIRENVAEPLTVVLNSTAALD